MCVCNPTAIEDHLVKLPRKGKSSEPVHEWISDVMMVLGCRRTDMLGVGVQGAWTVVFCALDWMLVSEPDMEGGDSPASVAGGVVGWGWGGCLRGM